MTDRLKGKTALILGAGCVSDGWGNGNATAVAFAREGANIVSVDIDEDAAARTADLVRKEGGSAIHVKADVADFEEVDQAVQLAVETYGRVDILHNNAGANAKGGPVETSEEDWDRVMQVNAKGAFLGCKAVIPVMKRQGGGSIIHISSIASVSWTGHPFIAYHASKAALNHMTHVIAVQHAADNIRCNCISPGLIDSPRIYGTILSFYDGDVERMRRERSQSVPLKRMGDVWDIANAAVFFASDESKYVTGVVMPVDGGITCAIPH
ncbi:oxidoreductase [Advenella kashmirensis W13003]|uniref:Oxidoreductase n=1 Tax=Advenella kashmirensis W13003 TaxID=1424334 RepID=V8QWY0_9BURK|nr:glucose 1-dehydrogenase [Advenella kashmirensis]ETF04142.1 oxidoreductase [Advenella kashmirensis W13003]